MRKSYIWYCSSLLKLPSNGLQEARTCRNSSDWYGKIKRGEIKLPRFQRHEAWDRQRIASLLETVAHRLPLGITLTLEVGEEEKFIS